MRKILISVLLGIALLMNTLFIVACNNAPQNSGPPVPFTRIELVNEPAVLVEIGDNITIPDAVIYDENDSLINKKVEIIVTNPIGIIVATSPIEIKSKIAGEYKIEYSYPGAETITKTVVVQDTGGPEIELLDVFYNMFVNQAVKLPNVKYTDGSGIDARNATLKVYYKADPNKTYEISNMLTFVPDQVGTYVYEICAVDDLGNSTTEKYEFTIVDKAWMDADATGMDIATFDKPEYVNVFGGGTATDREGNSDVTILDTYEGATGVAKVEMNMFDHNFGAYGSFNLRFPREYRYSEGTRLAIRLRAEELVIYNNRITLTQFEHTHVYAVGIDVIGQYYLTDGEWMTIILDNGALNRLKDENGYIKGIQLDVMQSQEHLDKMCQTIYIDSVTEIQRLETPANLRVEGNKIKWNAVDGASAYVVEINGTEYKTTATEYDLNVQAYTVCVKAVGNGVYFEDSFYSAEIKNKIAAPTGLAYQSDTFSWTAVQNATGYVVKIGETEIDVGTETSYVFTGAKDKNYVFRVKTKADGINYQDSDYEGIAVRFVAQADGYVADFGDETFVYDVINSNSINLAPMAAAKYSAEYLEEYEGKTGVLKIKMTINNYAPGWAVISLKLPQTLSLIDIHDLSFTYRLEGTQKNHDNSGLRIYGMAADGNSRGLNDVSSKGKDAWATITVAKEVINGIGIGFNGSTSSDYILFGVADVPPGTEVTLYLDSICVTYGSQMAKPENLVYENGTFTWEAVENATQYEVEVNGTKYIIEETTFNYVIETEGNVVFKVKVLGNGKEIYDSEQATCVIFNDVQSDYDNDGNWIWGE